MKRSELKQIIKEVIEESKLVQESSNIEQMFENNGAKTPVKNSEMDKFFNNIFENAINEILDNDLIVKRTSEDDIKEKIHELTFEEFDSIFRPLFETLPDEIVFYFEEFGLGEDEDFNNYIDNLLNEYYEILIENLNENYRDEKKKKKYGHPSLSAAERNR